MHQGRVDLRRPLIAHDQPPEVVQPRVGALDNPAPAIAAQAAPILMRGPTVVGAGGNNGLNAPSGQGGSDGIAIVAAIGNQPDRPAAGTAGPMGTRDVNRGQGDIQQSYFGWGRR